MDYNTLYTEIGKMAYAVAKSNGVVMETETQHLFNFIDQEIKETGQDAALSSGAEFIKLRRMNASARDAFSSFIGYVDKHRNAFEQRIVNLCLRLAIRIASSDDGMDETEVALINKLRKNFEGISQSPLQLS